MIPALLLALIHRSVWNRNSRKFAVASNQSNVAVSTLQRYSGTP
jgi:hypothetical protein